MDDRYKKRGYSADLLENESGAYMTISRHGKIIGEVSVGIMRGGPDHPVEITVRHFVEGELPINPDTDPDGGV